MQKAKKLFLVFLGVMLFPLLMEVRAASVPYNWIVDGETVDTTNASGTATLTKDGTNIVLTLNNYNGGRLQLNNYGSGQNGLTFTIHLIGNNTIKVDEGSGIVYNYESNIQFTGEGNLTIDAPQPVSYEDYASKLYISPSEQIYTDNPTGQNQQDQDMISDTEEKEDTNDNQATDNKEQVEQTSSTDNNIILYILIGGYVLLSLLVIIYLMVQNKKKTNI